MPQTLEQLVNEPGDFPLSTLVHEVAGIDVSKDPEIVEADTRLLRLRVKLTESERRISDLQKGLHQARDRSSGQDKLVESLLRDEQPTVADVDEFTRGLAAERVLRDAICQAIPKAEQARQEAVQRASKRILAELGPKLREASRDLFYAFWDFAVHAYQVQGIFRDLHEREVNIAWAGFRPFTYTRLGNPRDPHSLIRIRLAEVVNEGVLDRIEADDLIASVGTEEPQHVWEERMRKQAGRRVAGAAGSA